MKKILLIALFFCAAMSLYAQDYEDVVYLKNGSVIRGLIVEQVPNQILKIQTRDGNLFVYNIEDVLKMTKELPLYQNLDTKKSSVKKSNASQSSFNKPRGYFGLVEHSLAPLGLRYGEVIRTSTTIINGYRVMPQFAVGAGVGLQGYCYSKEMTIPVFLHLRSDFLNRKVSPFIAFNIGYNLSILGGHYSGLMAEPSAGVGFNVGKKYRMTAGLGVAIERYRIFYANYSDDWEVALNVKVGFSF